MYEAATRIKAKEYQKSYILFIWSLFKIIS